MAIRLKAKTSPTGYIAEVRSPDLQSRDTVAEFPVARFDDDGFALVAHPRTGCLARAVELEGFIAVLPMWQANR